MIGGDRPSVKAEGFHLLDGKGDEKSNRNREKGARKQ
jgi:hypothetical protein